MFELRKAENQNMGTEIKKIIILPNKINKFQMIVKLLCSNKILFYVHVILMCIKRIIIKMHFVNWHLKIGNDIERYPCIILYFESINS